MRHAGVIGHPISHSLSPKIHEHWLLEYGLSGTYRPYDVRPDEFEAFLDRHRALGYAGFNVTLPHKEAAFRLATVVEPYTQHMGSVNTLTLKDNQWYGVNSDGFGFLEHLKNTLLEAQRSLSPGFSALILGCGGAARGIIGALSTLSPSHITVVARDPLKAQRMLSDLQPFFQGQCPVLQTISFEHWEDVCAQGDLIVNTTPMGMVSFPPLDLSLSGLKKEAILYDLVYTPLETDFLASGRRLGHLTIDGLGMLLHQAVVGFELWFGVKPTVTSHLRNAITRFLKA